MSEPAERPDPSEIGSREQLGQALTTLRLLAGLTVRELALRSGLRSATVGGYVTGKHLPHVGQVDVFRAMLAALGVESEREQGEWLAALTRIRAGSDGRAARRPPMGAAPYRGLAAFQPDDAELYFGRGDATALVLARLAELASSTVARRPDELNMIFVVGASGTGKSSLLRAGLTPQVTAGALPGPGGARRQVAIMTPGPNPMAALAQALEAAAEPRLLIVDQFEEIFTVAGDEERTRFLTALAELGRDTLLVAGMRADFYPAAAGDPRLVDALQDRQVVVPPMTEDELRAAITEPARLRGVTVDDGLVETLLADIQPRRGRGTAVAPNTLPLLSHVLLATWDRHAADRLTVADYRAAGGLAGAIQLTAEEVFGTLSEQQRELARRLFLRMVAIGEDQLATRRRIDRRELEDLTSGGASALEEVIELYVARRLLTVDAGTVEISHEALLATWPRLADWIRADQNGLFVHRQLTAAANAWQAAGRDEGALLRGAQLAAAQDWGIEHEHRLLMNRWEAEFLAASVDADRAAARVARRTTTRLRALLAAVVVLAVVAGLAAVSARNAADTAEARQDTADAQRDQALSRQVAIEATRAAATDPALAQQLALAAFRISPTVDARSALLDVTATGVVNRLLGVTGPTTMRLSPDGTVLAVSHATDGSVHLYRFDGDRPGPQLAVIPAAEPASQLFTLAFNHTGRLLATGGTTAHVHLYNVTDPAHPVLASTLPGGFGGDVESVAFNADGSELVAGSTKPALRRWDIRDPAHPAALPEPAGTDDNAITQTVAYSPDGSQLAAGNSTGAVQVWPATSLNRAPAAVITGASAVDSIAYIPHTTGLLAADKDNTTAVIDLSGPGHRPRIVRQLATTLTSWANTVSVSADGRNAVLGGADGQIDVYDTGTWARTQAVTHPAQVTASAFSPDSSTIITAEADGTVRSWPVKPHGIGAGGGPIFAVAYDRRGHTLAVASTGHTGAVATYTVQADGSASRSATLAVPGSFGNPDGVVAITPDGTLIATANADGGLLLARQRVSDRFDPTAKPFAGGTQTIEGVAFSPDGHTLAAASDDGYLHLWDVSDPATPSALPPLNTGGEAAAVAFSPDGKYLAAASVDHHVHLWAVNGPRSYAALPLLEPFTNYAWSVAFSPDSTKLAAGGADNKIRMWRLAGSTATVLPPTLIGPTHYVFGLAFSPDGKTLAAAGGDGTVWTYSLTDPASPATLATLHTPGKSAYTVAYSPNGRTLTAADSSGAVTFWNSSVETAITEVCTAGGDSLSSAEWAQYVPGFPNRSTC